jgi:hypothetical protein
MILQAQAKTMLSKETPAQESNLISSHSGSGFGSSSDVQTVLDLSPKHIPNVVDLVKKSHRARPYIFKKKAPHPGAYPLNFSPYQMASHYALDNAVNLTPAEVYSDSKILRQFVTQEFPSHYFDEKGCAEDSTKLHSKLRETAPSYCCPRRDSFSRYSSRRKKLQ